MAKLISGLNFGGFLIYFKLCEIALVENTSNI